MLLLFCYLAYLSFIPFMFFSNLKAQDKRKALEETMTFTVQSLASVTYQINNLARNILKIFDLQTTHLQQVEANVCSIEQVSKNPASANTMKIPCGR